MISTLLVLLSTLSLHIRPLEGRPLEIIDTVKQWLNQWDQDVVVGRCFDTYAFPSRGSNGSGPMNNSALDAPSSGFQSYFNPYQDWKANLRCHVVEDDPNDVHEAFFGDLNATLDKLGLDPSSSSLLLANAQQFKSRVRLFEMEPKRWKKMQAVVAANLTSIASEDLDSFALGRTNVRGLVQSEVALSAEMVNSSMALSTNETAGLFTAAYNLVLPDPQMSLDSAARILFTTPTGYAIFSDIDDTIKITQVLNYANMFVNSFLKDYLPVSDMPELYGYLHEQLYSEGYPPSVFYVSGTPWQLVDALRSFLTSFYPLGELMLQPFAFTPGAFLGLVNVDDYKSARFDELHQRFPLKRWYLIGDSGQKDPEIYASIYEKNGDQVVDCIWIVKTTGTDAAKESIMNADERFKATFARVPADRWFAFTDPKEVMALPAGQCRP